MSKVIIVVFALMSMPIVNNVVVLVFVLNAKLATLHHHAHLAQLVIINLMLFHLLALLAPPRFLTAHLAQLILFAILAKQDILEIYAKYVRMNTMNQIRIPLLAHNALL